MISNPIILGAIILVGLTSTFILISKDWRWCIVALSVQYIGVFVLVDASWPLEMAVAKMVAGWMSGAILAIAMTSAPINWRAADKSIKFGPVFRVLAAIILVLTISSIVLRSESWLSIINNQVLIACLPR